MKVNDNKIESLSDVDELHNIFKDTNDYIFRGQANIEWDIIPKLLRHPKNNYTETLEKALFAHLVQGNYIPHLKTTDPIEYMEHLQHYSVPTRLLDFSHNIYKALYFACSDETCINKDGVLIICNKTLFLPYDFTKKRKIKPLWLKDPNDVKETTTRIAIDDIHYVEPYVNNPRIESQEGCFLFFSFATFNTNDHKYVDLISYSHKTKEFSEKLGLKQYCKVWYATINSKYKYKILEELEVVHGITNASIYNHDEPNYKTKEKYFFEIYKESERRLDELIAKKLITI